MSECVGRTAGELAQCAVVDKPAVVDAHMSYVAAARQVSEALGVFQLFIIGLKKGRLFEAFPHKDGES